MTNTLEPTNYGPISQTVIEKADKVCEAAAANGTPVRLCYGYNTTPDHNNLHCVDFMGDTACQNFVTQYLIDNAAEFGVMGQINQSHVMGFPSNENVGISPKYNGPEATWRTYYGPNPHNDHVHVQFNDVWGNVTPPIDTREPISLSALIEAAHVDPYAAQGVGIHPDHVYRLQVMLEATGDLSDSDPRWGRGCYGSMTKAAVKAVQTRLYGAGSQSDGIIGQESLDYLCSTVGQGFKPVP